MAKIIVIGDIILEHHGNKVTGAPHIPIKFDKMTMRQARNILRKNFPKLHISIANNRVVVRVSYPQDIHEIASSIAQVLANDLDTGDKPAFPPVKAANVPMF